MLVFDVAPTSHAFETFPASERMYFADEPRDWSTWCKATSRPRRIGAGGGSSSARSRRNAQNPGIAALQLPDDPALQRPRAGTTRAARSSSRPGWAAGWVARRAATTRWCSGRWCATTPISTIRWDSRRAAIRVDFQTGANAYLYGTRFFTWLAYVYSPEKVIAWIRRDEGSERYYADQFQQVFGLPLEQAWQDWIVFEHEFQRSNLDDVRKFPITPQRNLVATRDRLDVADVLRRSDRHALRRLPRTRRRRARRRAEHAGRQRPAPRRHQGRRCCTGSRRSPTTPAAGRRSSPTTTSSLPRPDGGGRARPARSGCCSRMRGSARSSSTRSTVR